MAPSDRTAREWLRAARACASRPRLVRCRDCGGRMEQRGPGRDRRRCVPCKARFNRARQRHPCPRCGRLCSGRECRACRDARTALRPCRHCQRPFRPQPWRGRRFCSEACRVAHRRHQARCRGCGAAFVWTRAGRRTGQFCSRACYFRTRRAVRPAPRCARPAPPPRCACGAALAPRHRFCEACRKARARAAFHRHWTSHAVHVERRCRWCERPFVTRTAAQEFCCRRCGHRCSRVSLKHGLTRTTDPEILRAHRAFGDVVYFLSCGRPLEGGIQGNVRQPGVRSTT
jgi:hypothetical protein